MPENVDAVHSMISADRKIVSQKDSRDSADTPETCRIHHVLDMRKRSAKWVPHKTCDRAVASLAILEHFWRNTAGFLERRVTMEGTWIYLYDPETKEQST